MSLNNILAQTLDTFSANVFATADGEEPNYDGNIVGGDYKCWCEIASVGIVWSRQRDWDACALEIMLSNILCLIYGQVARDGQTHIHIFHLGIPSWCIGSQGPAKTLQPHRRTRIRPLLGASPGLSICLVLLQIAD